MRPSFFHRTGGIVMLENMKLDQKLDKEEYKERKDAPRITIPSTVIPSR